MRPWFGLLCLSIVTLCVGQRQRPIYMNQFAVHIPKGSGQAEQIAAKHGFNNIGQYYDRGPQLLVSQATNWFQIRNLYKSYKDLLDMYRFISRFICLAEEGYWNGMRPVTS
ncbi:hypothetical protein QTP88_026149 [Uroleucon formosanum]